MPQTSRTWSVIWHDRESLISTVGRRAAFQPSCGRSGPGWRVAVLRVAFMKKEEKVSGSCDWQSGWGLGGQRGPAPSASVCWANLDEAPVWVMARAHGEGRGPMQRNSHLLPHWLQLRFIFREIWALCSYFRSQLRPKRRKAANKKC